jgi:hypothetical protein
MRRRDFAAFLTSAIAIPRLALAQDRPKLARVGFLGPAPQQTSRRASTRCAPGYGSWATSRART